MRFARRRPLSGPSTLAADPEGQYEGPNVRETAPDDGELRVVQGRSMLRMLVGPAP